MAFYQVEGTSLICWRLLVEGRTDADASAAALKIAGRLSDLRRDRALRDARHQVASARRVIDTPAADRVDQRPPAPAGDE